MTRRVSLPGVDELFRSSKATSIDADTDSRNGETNLQIVKDTDTLDTPQPSPTEAAVQPEAPKPEPAAQAPVPAAPAAAPALPVPTLAAAPAPSPTPAASIAPPAANLAATPPALPVPPAQPEADEGRRPRHEEKVTFYCTGSDLTRIERARLALRADHKLASDRGRIVRAALAEILDDFEQRGADSALVARLRIRSE